MAEVEMENADKLIGTKPTVSKQIQAEIRDLFKGNLVNSDYRWLLIPGFPLELTSTLLEVANKLLGRPAPIVVSDQLDNETGAQIRGTESKWVFVDALHVSDRAFLIKSIKHLLQEFPTKKFVVVGNDELERISIPSSNAAGTMLPVTNALSLSAASDDTKLLRHSRKLTPKYSLEQLVLGEKTKLKFKEAIEYIQTKSFCEREWGFKAFHSRGHGATLLFHGPSGTGKTMAAEVIASALNTALYQVDLSSIFSKWVGETEKNLKSIFEAARGVNGILLFDEGDAIFGQRTKVEGSQDRYSNLEVNYLLQEIETFDGIAILSTNYESNLDPAFLRRFTYTINFGRPDATQRLAIWANNIPSRMPIGEVDFTHLSAFPLTGGSIKNCIRSAASRAAAQKHRDVNHVDFLWAIKRELQKHGQELDRTVVGEHYWRLVSPEWEFRLFEKKASIKPAAETVQ